MSLLDSECKKKNGHWEDAAKRHRFRSDKKSLDRCDQHLFTSTAAPPPAAPAAPAPAAPAAPGATTTVGTGTTTTGDGTTTTTTGGDYFQLIIVAITL